MLTVVIRFGDGSISTDTDEKNLIRAMRDPQALFWLDMSKPTDEELYLLDEVFGFHPLAIEDSIQYSQRPKVESYRHTGEANAEPYFYMVIHGPDLETFRENLRTKELDIFMSARYLVTIHEEEHRSIRDVRSRALADPHLVLGGGIDMLLHSILDLLVDNYTPILDWLQEELDELEEQAVSNPQPDLLPRIAQKKRELLNFRRIIGPQREVIAQLTRGEVPFIRESTRVYLRDVLDHLVRAVEMIELYRDLVIGARDIYMSSISNNLNRVMKALTIITVCALPATVITSFYGQNFEVPLFKWLLEHYAGFWVSMGAIVAIVLALLYMFRRLKWL
ncbi:MAG: magnesium/cobalt transporter CorA [Phycisphaerales bacterium]|nr:magnesium/cobalt transporter CorA [Phycisphaerales bacterium]